MITGPMVTLTGDHVTRIFLPLVVLIARFSKKTTTTKQNNNSTKISEKEQSTKFSDPKFVFSFWEFDQLVLNALSRNNISTSGLH